MRRRKESFEKGKFFIGASSARNIIRRPGAMSIVSGAAALLFVSTVYLLGTPAFLQPVRLNDPVATREARRDSRNKQYPGSQSYATTRRW